MSFKWLLRVLKGGRAKLLTSAKNNINILSLGLYKHRVIACGEMPPRVTFAGEKFWSIFGL